MLNHSCIVNKSCTFYSLQLMGAVCEDAVFSILGESTIIN